jgi:hypothetical protein
MPKYQYSELSLPTNIRLLRLLPGRKNLRCEPTSPSTTLSYSYFEVFHFKYLGTFFYLTINHLSSLIDNLNFVLLQTPIAYYTCTLQ